MEDSLKAGKLDFDGDFPMLKRKFLRSRKTFPHGRRETFAREAEQALTFLNYAWRDWKMSFGFKGENQKIKRPIMNMFSAAFDDQKFF